MLIISLLFLIFAESMVFAGAREPLAKIMNIQGEVALLRNPVRQRSTEFDRRVNARIHQVSFYQGWYWEAYPVNLQTQVAYGDLIRTAAGASVEIKIQSSHDMTLSENSVVNLVPDFIQLLEARTANPSVQINAGKMRLKVNPDANFGTFTVRSATMLMDLKKSDLLIAVKGKVSEVISLDGQFTARKLSTKRQTIYWQSLEQYRSRNYRELGRLTATQQMDTGPVPLELSPGNKAQAWEDLNEEDRANLIRLLGAEKTRADLDAASRFESISIQEIDLDYYADLLPDIDEVRDKLDFADSGINDIDDGHELRGTSEAFEDLGKAPSHRLLSVRLGYFKAHNEFNESYSLNGRSLALELEYRPWKYIYSYIGISSGVADTKDMANFLGQDQPEPLNSLSHVALGLGGRAFFSKRLALSLGAGVIHIQRLSVQYDDHPSNVNRTYTVTWDPIPIAEIGMSVIFPGAIELFARYGLGSSFTRIEAKDIADDYVASGSFSYGTIGLAWSSE